MSGNSQAVRIPKDMRLSAETVSIERIGSRIIIYESGMAEKITSLSGFMEALNPMPDWPLLEETRDSTSTKWVPPLWDDDDSSPQSPSESPSTSKRKSKNG